MIELTVLQADRQDPEYAVKIEQLADDLAECQLAFQEATERTVGCPGVIEQNQRLICRSPQESEEDL
jgi:hypothetical protein